MKKKVLSILLAMLIVVTMVIVPVSTVSAASYPAVMHKSIGMQAYCGDTIPLIFTYFPAYNNERITVNIYSSSGALKANSVFNINNKYSNYGSLTVTWDTEGYEPGKYNIEVVKEFYSYYSWHTTPTNSSSFVTLVEPSSTMSLNNEYKGSYTHFEVRNNTSVLTASNTNIKYAYNAWQKLKVTNISQPYEIQMTEMYIGDEAQEIALDENMYNAKNNSSCQWVLTKFEIKNTGSSTLEASDTIDWLNAYLPTGEKATVIDTCTFGDLPHYDTEIEPGETKEVWFGFYLMKYQGIPFLKLENGAYISTHPSCAKGHKYTNNCDDSCNTCHCVRNISHTYTTTTTKATITKNGSIVKKCTSCGNISTNTTIKCANTFTLSTTSYTYDGKVKTPTVTVKDSSGKTLKKDTDYTVNYPSGRKNAGTYKVTVTMKGNYSGNKTLSFKINPSNISSCKLSTTEYTYNGKVKTPSVTVKNASGKTLKKNTDYTVTYAKGRKNVGTYKVTVKGKGIYSGTKVLTFKIKPTSKTSISIPTGGTSKIGAKSNKKITYKSSNKKVATVSSKGVITAKTKGSATITVKSNGISQKITVKVVKPSVKISGDKNLVIKKKLTLKATTNTGAKIKWSTSNSKVAKVSSSGKVTGVKKGTAYIYAKVTYKGKTYTAKHKITVKNPYVSLNKTSLTLSSGESYTLTAKANPKATVKYKSSNKSVAKVSSSGKITTYTQGDAQITAYFTYGGKTYSKVCNVKVTAKDYSKIVLYEDSSVKITFKSAEKSKYDDNEVELYFNVKNKTGKTLLIQADAVSLNGYSFCDLTMSDEVAAYSTGVINLSVDSFDFDLVSNIYSIKSIGGQFRIIDDDSWDSYNAIFKNIRLDGKGIASKPSFNKGKLVYSDSQCAIYYRNIEKSKYEDTEAEMYFYLENKTDKTLLIQADAISVNGYSHNDLIMSDPVLAQSIGIINLSVDDFNFSSININNIKTLGGQFNIIDDASWDSYDAIFTNVSVK